MSGGGGTNTTTSSAAPPQQFLDAYSNVVGQAGNVANTGYTPYQGQTVADLSPDQQAAISTIQNSQGIANPYINSAAQHIDAATAPIWANAQQFSPGAVQQYESPYTQQVVDATQAQFNNANQQQQQSVIGDAVSKGAWGGDRSAVAQGIVAGQQQLAQAPVIAGLKNQGYSQALNEFNTQQQSQIGANEAQGWLHSQAGAAMAGLGQEAQSTALAGANAQLGVGALEQQQAQSQLNVPYQQYIAQQAYPFQTTGWLANIAEGLGGASGGKSSTTSPSPSVASQVGGGLVAGAGILGQTGAYGSNGWLSGSGSGSGGGFVDSGSWGNARGGVIPERAAGGIVPIPGVPDVSVGIAPGVGEDISVVPGSSGLGSAPATHGQMDILKNYGSTSTTTNENQDSTFGTILKTAGIIAANIYGTPAGGAAASALSSQVHFAHGGIVANDNQWWDDAPEQKRAAGGIAMMPSAHGGPSIPQLTGGPSGGGIAPPSSLSNYFANTLAARSFAPPPNLPHLNFSNLTSPGQQSPAQLAKAAPPVLTGTDLVGTNANFGGDSGGGGGARGGVVSRFDDGGDVPDDDQTGPALDPSLRSGLSDLSRLPTNLASSEHIHRNESRGSMAPGIVGDGGLAGGVMQVHQAALTDVNKAFGTHYTERDLIDHPEIGRAVGNAYYGMQRDRFGGDDRLATAAYQAGPGAVQGALDGGQGIAGLSPHTQDYVARAGFGGAGGSDGAPPPTDQYDYAVTSEPAGGIAAPHPEASPSSSPWRTLTNVGLGIMAGTSPNTLTNIGRGAEQGIQVSDRERQTEASSALAKQHLQSQQQGQAETARSHRANESEAAASLSQRAADAAARLKVEQQRADTSEGQGRWIAGYGPDANGNQVPGMYFASKTGDEPTFHPGAISANAQAATRRGDQADRRLDQGDTRLTQGQQRIQQSQEYHDQTLALRREGLDNATVSNIMNNASRMVEMTPGTKLEDAVAAQKRQRATMPAHQPAAAPAPPAAPVQQPSTPAPRPPLSSIFGQ